MWSSITQQLTLLIVFTDYPTRETQKNNILTMKIQIMMLCT